MSYARRFAFLFASGELLLGAFCCVWVIGETLHDSCLIARMRAGEFESQSFVLSGGTRLEIATLWEGGFLWPTLRRSSFDNKLLILSDEGKAYARIVQTSSIHLCLFAFKRIVELNNVDAVENFLMISSFETQLAIAVDCFTNLSVGILVLCAFVASSPMWQIFSKIRCVLTWFYLAVRNRIRLTA